MSIGINGIKFSNNTFIVERTVFSNIFPDLKGNRLRVYLLLCRVAGVKPNGLCFMSQSSICSETNQSLHDVRLSLEWLSKNYFIEKVNSLHRSNTYRVLVTPDYDRKSNQYFSNSTMLRSRYALKDTLNGYCEIPVELMKGNVLKDHNLWSDRKIKVFGQLYLYHWISEYGGVDPKVVGFKNNRTVIDELMAYSIGCTQSEVTKPISWLKREGFLIKLKTVYRPNTFSCYKELQYIGDLSMVKPLPSDKIIEVLRLTIIPELKFKDAIVRTGGKIQL